MVVSQTLFLLLIGAVAVERAAELVLSKRHIARALARGGREYGAGHYPAMVVLHSALLIGSVAEVLVADRPFLPWLGWPALAVALAAQGLRWWCISTLGPRWNTRVIVVPGISLVTSGPYRWLRHPNYVAVIVEGFALPLVGSAWITACIFTVLNLPLLAVRRRVEEQSLADAVAVATL